MFYTKEKLEETKKRRELHRQAVERRLKTGSSKPKKVEEEKDPRKENGYLGDDNELGR